MEEIKISDLPEYAKNSKIYEAMEADEIVFVPKKYLIYNKKINNFKDYKKLIKAYNYFLLELSDEIINFQKNPENKYDVLKFLIKNRDSAFFREQLDIFEEPILKTQINYNLHVVNFREIYFSSDYIFEKGNLKININNIKISESECKYYLSKIKNSESFTIISENNIFFISFKDNDIITFSVKKTRSGHEYFPPDFLFEFITDKKNIIKEYQKIIEGIKKCKKLIKSKKLFGISFENNLQIGLLIKENNLVIENFEDFFDEYSDKIKEKGVNKENIRNYLKNRNRIINL